MILTTLNGALNATALTCTVTDGSVLPLSVTFPIRIDNEEISCTRSSNTLTIKRGQQGTLVAAHDDGSDVDLILGDELIYRMVERLEEMNQGVLNKAINVTPTDVTGINFSFIDGILYIWVTDQYKELAQTEDVVTHALATAANDFIVASGSGVFVKKTLAETKTILAIPTFATTQVFTGHKGATYEDLDLSGTIGAKASLVLLRATTLSAASALGFRKNGEASTPTTGGIGYLNLTAANLIGYIMTVTDSGGICEWSATNTLEKLVGRDDVALSTTDTANYRVMTKFTAGATGYATQLRFRANATTAGNVVIGVYADNAGAPAALLASKATAVDSGAERVISVTLDSALSITSGTVYWIASESDAAVVGVKTETSVRLYKAHTYDGTLPDPAGTGYTGDTTNSNISAAWGDKAITLNLEAYF